MRLIISFLFFFVVNTSFAQDKKVMSEEEYANLKYKIRSAYNINVDSAIVYANQMARSNNYKHLAFANAALSFFFQTKGDREGSCKKYKKALYYLDKVPESRDKTYLRSYIYNYGGLTDWIGENYAAAIEKFQKGMKLSKQINDFNQISKFLANIALVNEAIGNYQLSIKRAREVSDFLHENKDMFAKEDFITRKSNIYHSLGNSYEGYFMSNHSKRYLLDSAEYFYKKCIDYSGDFPSNKITSKLSLGNVYNFKEDYQNAEKTYNEVALLAKQYNQKSLLCNATFNLADVYYSTKKYNKALVYYKRSDSISLITKVNQLSFLKSNYYQSKIYTIFNKPELAYKHSLIYLDSKKQYFAKLNKEKAKANNLQGIDNLTREMISVEKNYEKKILLDRILKTFFLILFIVIVLFIKKKRNKNKVNKKLHALIKEFKTNIERKNHPWTEMLLDKSDKTSPKKETVNLNIERVTENSIIESLLELESNLEYLKTDFTLSNVALKIKTNTTYLSYVVNKRFGKPFGKYANELKINYAINKMITNEEYRKSSTKTMAKSVGFKNACSFARSFRKRTGISPAQFANKI